MVLWVIIRLSYTLFPFFLLLSCYIFFKIIYGKDENTKKNISRSIFIIIVLTLSSKSHKNKTFNKQRRKNSFFWSINEIAWNNKCTYFVSITYIFLKQCCKMWIEFLFSAVIGCRQNCSIPKA